MTRLRIVLGLFGAALFCGIAFVAISNATVMPVIAGGASADGVRVTTSGWLALIVSGLSTAGLTLAGILTAIANRIGLTSPSSSRETVLSELIELSASFAALMSDKSNRAAQRRFLFALVDAASLIQGCQTSHEAGVVIIKYSGYATAATPTDQGAQS